MANRTDPAAKTIRGTDPQNLVEKILRFKIWQSTYWKKQCFGLTAETLVDKAIELNHLGCTFGGNRKPTPFMCLVMKMLQIQPEKEIILEFIKNNDYKYVRVLGAFYLRLTGTDVDVYRYLEPLYNDYRKLKLKSSDGRFSLTRVDEIIDELLTKDSACDVPLPRIKKRWTLESIGSLEPRKSALEDDFEEEEDKEEEDEVGAGTHRRRDGHKYRDGDYDREYGRGRDMERESGIDRHRDRDRERGRRRYCLRDHEKEDYYGCEGERERERGMAGRERDSRRDREWGRRRWRSPSRRSRSTSRDRNDDGRKRHTRGRADEEPKKKNEKKTDHHPDPEIAEANRMRASLGLKPLKL